MLVPLNFVNSLEIQRTSEALLLQALGSGAGWGWGGRKPEGTDKLPSIIQGPLEGRGGRPAAAGGGGRRATLS